MWLPLEAKLMIHVRIRQKVVAVIRQSVRLWLEDAQMMNYSEVTFGPGYPDMFEDIAALYNATSRPDNPDHVDLDGGYFRRSYERLKIDLRQDVATATTPRLGLVGMGLVTASARPDMGYVSVMVHPAARRIGIGSRLLSTIEDMVAQRGLSWAEGNVPSYRPEALRFATKRGYSVEWTWLKMMHHRLDSVRALGAPQEYTIIDIPDERAEEWAALQNAIFEGQFRYRPVTGEYLVEMRKRGDLRNGLAVLAMKGNQPVGYCLGLVMHSADPSIGKRLLIHGIGVVPEHRGRGLGRSLCTTVMHRAARMGMREAELVVDSTNTAAIRMYEAIGFEQRYKRHWLSKKLVK